MKVEIEKLIEIGKDKFKLHKKTQYYIDSEYFIIYSNAVNFLINNYNQITEKEINKIFEEKIPKLFNNKECENVLIELENLKNTNSSIRLNASRFFRKQALKSIIGFREMIFKRTDTIEQLINALNNEKNDKVIAELVITLGQIYSAYFKHFRIPNVLLPYLFHKKSEVRYYAVIWTANIEGKERDILVKKLYAEEKTKKVRQAIENQWKDVKPKEFYKKITTKDGASKFQVRCIENEGIGMVTTENNKHYLILDSKDYWNKLVEDSFPKIEKCKHEWFELIYYYTIREDSDDVKEIEVLTNCEKCNRIKTILAIDIDYSPTGKLLSEPITIYKI